MTMMIVQGLEVKPSWGKYLQDAAFLPIRLLPTDRPTFPSVYPQTPAVIAIALENLLGSGCGLALQARLVCGPYWAG